LAAILLLQFLNYNFSKKEDKPMKIKKFNKRLGLNKSTVVNLNNIDMSNVKGRGETGDYVKTVDITRCATGCFFCPTEMPSKCPILC
jgi:hypothetical protein